jgi:hypothetical protein
MTPETVTLVTGLGVALLSFAGTALGSILSHRKQGALVAYRLEQLEKKMDKHNNLVERTYELEATTQVLIEKVNHIEKDMEED